MRNKKMPMKSSRHKSVASVMNCPAISFQPEERRQGVMRLAFFENNDITPETWKDFDFNTLSSLILNRNIHHDLQDRDDQQHQQQQQQQEQPTNYATTTTSYAPQSPIDDPLNISQPSTSPFQAQSPQYEYSFEQDYSPEQVYSPPPVFARKPSASVPRSTSASSRTAANSARASIGASRSAQLVKAESRSARPTDLSKHTNLSKATHIQRATSTSHHHHNQHHQQPKHHQPQKQSNNSAESKILTNHSGQYLCEEPDCGKTFPSLRKLRHHKVVHSNEFPFMCQFQGCGKRFKRKFGIDLHSTTHFDLDPEMYVKTSNNSSLEFFGRRMQYSMCKPCNQKFKTVHEYQDHMLGHGKEPFKCLVEGCGQTFSIWKSFQKHRASHYFNYYCKIDSQCNHSTSNLQLLKLHIYCCHFRRTLPENATLTGEMNGSYDMIDAEQPAEEEEDEGDDQLMDEDHQDGARDEPEQEEELFDELEVEDPLSLTQETSVSTPRRDPRLRRNPPRSSNFKHQDIDQNRKHLRQVNINKGSSLIALN